MKRQTNISCDCGKFRGIVNNIEHGTRAVCYCADCQLYAQYLQPTGGIVNCHGGTEVVAVRPTQITIVSGVEYLSCVSLTQVGAYRFYTHCCNTPICNMARNYRTEHISLIHSCLTNRCQTSNVVSSVFGANALHVKRHGAIGNPPPNNPWYFVAASVKYACSVTWSYLRGGYRVNPFINQQSQTPVVGNHILSALELKNNSAQHKKYRSNAD